MMKNNILQITWGVIILSLVFLLPGEVLALPGTTVLSKGVEKAYGEIPETEGFRDASFQAGINGHIREAVNQLKALVKGKNNAFYSYEVEKNTPDFLSIVMKVYADGGYVGAKSVNIDMRSGNAYSFSEFFTVNDEFFTKLENQLGWRPDPSSAIGFSSQGIVFISGQGEKQTVPYNEVFKWLHVSKLGYYIDAYYLTENANDKLFRGKVGDIVILRLETNKTTGFSWVAKNTDYQPVLEYVGSSYLLTSNQIGASGYEMFVFGLKEKGEVNLEMDYKRGWEKQTVRSLKIRIISE